MSSAPDVTFGVSGGIRSYNSTVSAVQDAANSAQIYVTNPKGSMSIIVNSEGRMGLYDRTGEVYLVYRNADDIATSSNNGNLRIGSSYLYTKGLRPSSTNEWSCGTADYAWYNVGSRRFYVYDGTNTDVNYGRLVVSAVGTTSDQGYTSLYLGNDKAAKTKGGAYGRVVFYSSGTGSATIRATLNTDTETTHVLPTTGGTLVNTSGATFSGDIGVDKNSTADTYVKCINNNGSVALHAATNRGVYDITEGKWMVYSKKGEGQVRTPGGLIVAYGGTYPSNPVAGQVYFKTS